VVSRDHDKARLLAVDGRLDGDGGRIRQPVIVIPDEATATLDETGETVAGQAA
jgi:hypothetical protein